MQLPFLTKYRPIFFNDYINDHEIISFLKILVQIDSLNLLFIGNSGSGKTTMINSIIKEYYKDSDSTNDEIESNILYINSLKEQGIHYYRNNVKTFCQTTSAIKNKKKIVVLDDIDYINEQSQQVFRNCIDKYSKNVHFIASCLNIQKVIDSIQSRVFIIKIKSHKEDKLITILNTIIEKENITMTMACKRKLIAMSNHSIRILINYLEKIKLIGDKVTPNLIDNICNNICFDDFKTYISICMEEKDVQKASQLLLNIYEKGYSVIDIFDNFFLYVKNCNELDETQKYKMMPVICKYISVFYNVHEDEIELALFTNSLIKIFK